MKRLLAVFGVAVACAACCAIPLALPMLAALAASGLGLATLGWPTAVVLLLATAALGLAIALRNRRTTRARAVASASAGACGCSPSSCSGSGAGFVMTGQQADAAEPIACRLETPELKSRLAEIGALAGRALLGYARDGRTLHLRYATDAAVELERLVDRERRCCGFLRLDLHHASDAVHLAITAPITAPVATGEFAPMLYAHFIGQPLAPMSGCNTSCGCGCGSRSAG